MNKKTNLQTMCAAALLCAIAILVPLVMPIKVVLEPMSFTLASHVAIFIAMFISPAVGVAVNLGATVGFLFAIPSPVVWLRAASQTLFVFIGGWLLKKHPKLVNSKIKLLAFGAVISLVHAIGEMVVVASFYMFGGKYQDQNALYLIFVLVGIGTFVHSMVDFVLALAIWKPACRYIRFPIALNLQKSDKATQK